MEHRPSDFLHDGCSHLIITSSMLLTEPLPEPLCSLRFKRIPLLAFWSRIMVLANLFQLSCNASTHLEVPDLHAKMQGCKLGTEIEVHPDKTGIADGQHKACSLGSDHNPKPMRNLPRSSP